MMCSFGRALCGRWIAALVVAAAWFVLAPHPLAMAQPAGETASAELRVSSIEVEGNLRVEREAVIRAIPLDVGDPITQRSLGDAVRAVFDLGFFEDVQIDATVGAEGVVLTFIVFEKPSIGEVVIRGNDALDEDEITEEINLQVGSILDEQVVRAGADRISELYREKGYYLVDVNVDISEGDPGEVVITYDIEEHARVQVGRVTFVGNEALSDRDLSRFMATREGSWLSFLTKQGLFQREEFQTDLQRLRFLYYDSGYLDVAVSDPVVEISRDREQIYITIPIEEGTQYFVADVSVAGDMLVSQEELMELVTLTPGQAFRSSTVRSDIERITNLYRERGYAMANVNMLTRDGADPDTVSVQYDIQRGELCYIGRIEVVGNHTTRDLVVRREMIVEEGDQYNGVSIDRSERYIQQLGLFEEVTIREQPSRTNARVIDLEIEVTERATRSLQVGAGFSSADSFIATAQIEERNLFGRGQSLTLNAQLSSLRSLFVLSFFEPYLFSTRLSFTLDLFRRQVVYSEFERDSLGFGLRFGYRPFRQHRFWRALTLSLGYNLEDVSASPIGASQNRAALAFYDGGLTSSVTAGVQLDRRNDRIYTTRGYLNAFNVELAESVFGSENEFLRLRGISRWYAQPDFLDCGDDDRGMAGPGTGGFGSGACRWLRQWVGKLNLEVGYIAPTNPVNDVPVFERFYTGGPNSVRGFERFSLSPTTPVPRGDDAFGSTNDRLTGGFKELYVNLELEFPLLNALGLRGVMFFDAGNAFDRDEPYTARLDLFSEPDENALRTAVGFGFRWRSPIGPLRFEWGYPLVPRPGERRSVFEFSIANSF